MNHNEPPKYRCAKGTSTGGQKKSEGMRKSLPKALSEQKLFKGLTLCFLTVLNLIRTIILP